MSDNWIVIIPENPYFVADGDGLRFALDLFSESMPDADEVTCTSSPVVKFFDCGENFERIACPSCAATISTEWWKDRMEEDYGEGFKLAYYPTPCCARQHTLHELKYDFPQGFGKWSLEAMNPNVGELNPEIQRELETILATPLRVIYQRI